MTSTHLVRADVGVPLKIKLTPPAEPVAAGVEYSGSFLVQVFETGEVDQFELGGRGWDFSSQDNRSLSGTTLPGDYSFPFVATTRHPNEPIELSLRWNGRLVSASFEVGPKYFEQAGARHSTRQTKQRSGMPPVDAKVPESGGATPIQVVGRWMYERTGIDANEDGDFDDPDDVPPVDVGVDGMGVSVFDNDAIGAELIWSGVTDSDGYFDTGVVQWDDCDELGCDAPDIVIEFKAMTDVVDVSDDSLLEETYTWETAEVSDFSGNFYDAGVNMPNDSSLHPALHILTNITRTHRFILSRTGNDTPPVQVIWPTSAAGVAGAFYQQGSEEIHIGEGRQWRDDTHAHEYGHHFINKFSAFVTPDYCNGFCDGDVACSPGTNCEDAGHCKWCPETDHDAWSEGWCNWLADVITRSYVDDYSFDDNTPFVPLYGSSQESIGECCQDETVYFDDATITEGFVGALLRDIEDETQDTHAGGSFFDSLCLGVDEIFEVVVNRDPTTVLEFLNWLRFDFPEYEPLLYPTAANVSLDYVVDFEGDANAPGVVDVLGSSTHPIGSGGSLPCIVFEWDHAPDEGVGVCAYSYQVTSGAPGGIPDTIPEPIGSVGCKVATSVFRDVGTYYLNIRAQDCGGIWSNEFSTFGPFEIIDCDESGLLDLCDISCDHPGYEGCALPPSFCNQSGCGAANDCQGNLSPDSCDVADGTSDDCNESGAPDECEEIYHWDAETGLWTDRSRWLEGSIPVDDSDVCIDVPGDVTVEYSQGALQLNTLACSESIDIVGSFSGQPDLTLNATSWIDGSLFLRGGTGTLRVNDRLDIGGEFHWTGSNDSLVAKLTGSGETMVSGGLRTSSTTPLDSHHLILGPVSNSTSQSRFTCPGNSTITIEEGGVLDHQGAGAAFSCESTDQLVNRGTIIRSAETGDSEYSINLINEGIIHIQSGTLTLRGGSTHDGMVIGDSGSVFRMRGSGNHFLTGSSILADRVQFDNLNGGTNSVSGTYNVTTKTTHNSMSTLNFTDESSIVSYGLDFDIQKGTVNFDAVVDGSVEFQNFTISNATANLNGGDPFIAETMIASNATITGPSSLTVNSSFIWGGGTTFIGPIALNILGTSTVSASGSAKTLRDGTVNNHGIMTMSGGFQMEAASSFVNHQDGVVDISVDSGASVIGGGPTTGFTNNGTLIKSVGPGTSVVSTPLANSGVVEIQTGKIQFRQQYVQTAGQTALNGGDFDVWWINQFTPPVLFEGGSLTGAGAFTSSWSVRLRNVGADIQPGDPIGAITVEGNYTQFENGTLSIDIGGVANGEYDTLDMTSSATLAGTLNVAEFDEFTAVPGDSFKIITASSVVGEFETVHAPAGYDVVYNAADVTLVARVVGDVDGDGDVDLDDYRLFQVCFAGENSPSSLSCSSQARPDLDLDGDVDLFDYVQLYQGTVD